MLFLGHAMQQRVNREYFTQYIIIICVKKKKLCGNPGLRLSFCSVFGTIIENNSNIETVGPV